MGNPVANDNITSVLLIRPFLGILNLFDLIDNVTFGGNVLGYVCIQICM